jgi:hypothetical protein
MKILDVKTVVGLMAPLCVLIVSAEVMAQDRYENRSYQSREHAHRTYQHIYYPSHQAYFSPHSNTWFWRDGPRWHSGYRVPYGINVRVGGIPIQLSSTIPYYQHRYVVSSYPRPYYVVRSFSHRHLERDRHHRPRGHRTW